MNISGHGLVVEHVLAKDETGVRFSLAAPSLKNPCFVDNLGDMVDKRRPASFILSVFEMFVPMFLTKRLS